MTRLIKGNVERIAASEGDAVRLEKDGYTRIYTAKEPAQDRNTKLQDQGTEPQNQGTENADAGTSLEGMTINELRKIAKEKGINGSFSLSKSDLIEILKEMM